MRPLRNLLRPFLNPIVDKELRLRLRTGGSSLIPLYLVTLAGVEWFTYLVVWRKASAGIVNGQLSVHAGAAIFRALAGCALVLILFIAPALTAAAIAGEREGQTLDLLLCTRVRPSSIVIGKLVASLLFTLLLLVASVPVFSVVFLFGGVELSQVIGVAAVLGVTAVVFGAMGLLCSTVMRRPAGATGVGYIVAFLYLLVPLGTSVVFPTSLTSRTVQAYAEIANPAFALGSTLLDTPIRSPTTAPTAPVAQNDKVQAGAFKGFRAWQAFATSSAPLVAIVVATSVAILSKRSVHLAGRRRLGEARRGPRREPRPQAAAAAVLSESTANE